jgi:hypothetical protein
MDKQAARRFAARRCYNMLRNAKIREYSGDCVCAESLFGKKRASVEREGWVEV